MAEDEATTTSESAVAVAERPEAPAAPRETAMTVAAPSAVAEGKKKKKKKKEQEEEPEYELEFETPFGKIEFEVEPHSSKERRDRRKREKAEQAVAKAAARAEKQLAKRGDKPAGRGGSLLTVLLIFTIIAAAVAIAIWLFARPGPEEQDQVPPEFLTPEGEPIAVEPQGFLPKMRRRIGTAIRAGRKASREAQQAQERRFEELSRGR